eukprot:8235069-Pyramimonas_sp.AAC.1
MPWGSSPGSAGGAPRPFPRMEAWGRLGARQDTESAPRARALVRAHSALRRRRRQRRRMANTLRR